MGSWEKGVRWALYKKDRLFPCLTYLSPPFFPSIITMSEKQEFSWRIYVVCFFSAFGGLTFGYDTGVLGVSIPFL